MTTMTVTTGVAVARRRNPRNAKGRTQAMMNQPENRQVDIITAAAVAGKSLQGDMMRTIWIMIEMGGKGQVESTGLGHDQGRKPSYMYCMSFILRLSLTAIILC